MAPDTPTPGEGEEGSGAVVEKGRVLLLEDDVSFNEVTRDYLVECGYTVVAVESGVDGIREVMAGDFTLILCDMAMPKMRGDMFYRAVERVRPHLCHRFVFMTGYRDDARTSEFIQQVGAYVLRKPFPLRYLLDSISFIEVLDSFESTFDGPAAAPLGSQVVPPPDPCPTGAECLQRDSPVGDEAPEPLAPAAADPAPPAPRASAPPPRTSLIPWTPVLAGLAFFIALAADLGIRAPRVKERASAASAERLVFEEEWTAVAARQAHAEQAHSRQTALAQRAQSLAEERLKGRWTGALRAISTVAGPAIELRGIAARHVKEPAGLCKVVIDGFATGRTPRLTADTFRNTLWREAEKIFPGPVAVHLDRLEDEPAPSAEPSDSHRARFTITLSVESNESANGEAGAAP